VGETKPAQCQWERRMNLPSFLLSRYISRHFFMQTMIVLGVMIGLIFIFDLVELMRRAASREHVDTFLVVQLALLKLPSMGQRVIPFAILIGCILALSKLTKTQELIIARAAGVSVWQFLFPCLAASIFISLITLGVINPLSASMLARFEQLEAQNFQGNVSMLSVSSSGLWLRQVDHHAYLKGDSPHTETIVHAMRVAPKEMKLFDVIIFQFNDEDRFLKRFDANAATLKAGHWALEDVTISQPNLPAERTHQFMLPTNLTSDQIQESFASPETMSFWELPAFIELLEEAGFTANRHRLHFYSMLAMPLFLCAMVLIAAVFALKPHRMGGTGTLISAGIFTGFIVYFLTDLVNALALSGNVPLFLAAWTTTIVSSILGFAVLLHLEDG
jgi:lipopolysaccharide export system permease protein